MEDDEAPPSWDEYDQMVNEAKAPQPLEAAEPLVPPIEGTRSKIQADEFFAGNSQVPGHVKSEGVKSESVQPPWDTTPQSVSVEKAESVTDKATSITDLLFSDDFPEPIENEALSEPEEVSTGLSSPDVEVRAEQSPAESAQITEVLVKSVIPEGNTDKWYQITQNLKVSGLAGELAKQCVLAHEDNEKIELHLDSSSEMLMTHSAINEIEAALAAHYGDQRKLVVAIRELGSETPAQFNLRRIEEIQQGAEQHIHNDEFVRQLSERFAARVVPGSVKPKT